MSRCRIEALEERRLLTVTWTNSNPATNGFNTCYGDFADEATAIVNQAISNWNAVVTDTTKNVSVTINADVDDNDNLPANVLGLTSITSTDSGRPTAATITLDSDIDVLAIGSNWYFDSTPSNHSEYANVLNTYAAFSSTHPSEFDYLSTVQHELGHALGVIPTGTLLATNPDGFAGDSTLYSSSGAIITSGGHIWQGPFVGSGSVPPSPPVMRATAPYSPYDLMNPGYAGLINNRTLISQRDVAFLETRWGYTVAGGSPSGYGGTPIFTSNVVGATLSIGALSSGNQLWHLKAGSGTSVSITVNGAQQADISINGITLLKIAGSSNNDTVIIDYNGGNPLPSVALDFSDSSGDDVDTLLVRELDSSTTSHDYVLSTSAITRDTVSLVPNDYAHFRNIGIYGSNGTDTFTFTTGHTGQILLAGGGGVDTFTINSVGTSEALSLYAEGGDDVITIGNGSVGNGSGTILIDGGLGSDTVTVADQWYGSATTYAITASAVSRTVGSNVLNMPIASAETLAINTSAGGDTINVASTNVITATTVSTGSGADIINVGNNNVLDGLAGPLTIAAGDGSDTLTINDQSQSGGNKAYTITDASVARTTDLAPINYSAVESLTLNTGGYIDTITVTSTSIIASTTVNTGDGNDVINVGNANKLDNVAGPLTVAGGVGTDTLNVNDQSQTTGPTTYTVTSSAVSLARSGTAPINYSATEVLNLRTSLYADLFNVQSTLNIATTTIYGDNGSDAFQVGNGNSLANIAGPLHLYLEGGASETITLNDQNGGASSTYTVTSGYVTRTGVAPIYYYSGTENIVLNTSGNADIINVLSTVSGVATTVNGLGGNDTFNVGSGNQLSSILGAVSLNGDLGTDAVNIYDSSTGTSNLTYTVTSSAVTRTGGSPASVTVNYVAETLNVKTSAAADIVNVTSTAVVTTTSVYGGSSSDVFNVGNGNVLSPIDGPLHLYPESGAADIIYINDQSNSSATYTVTSSSITRVGGDAAPINYYSGTENVVLNTSNSIDTINVNSTASGVTTTVYASDGDDAISVGTGNYLYYIGGVLNLYPGAGTDSVTLNDQSMSSPAPYVVTNSSVTRTGIASINYYSGTETLTLNASTASADTINVKSTSPVTTTNIYAGSGSDAINVGNDANRLDDIAGPLNLYPGAGTADTVNINDPAQSNAKTYTVTGSAVARSDVASINYYSGTEAVVLNVGSGLNTLFASSTSATTKLSSVGTMQSLSLLGSAAIEAVSSFTTNSFSVTNASNSLSVPNGATVTVPSGGGNAFSIGAFSASATLTKLGAGTLTVTAAHSHISGSVLNANAGTTNINSDTGGGSGTRNLTVNANAATNFGSTQHLAALNIAAGVTATVTSNGGRALVTSAISVIGTGKLDLTDNDMIVRSTSGNRTADLNNIRSLLASGYASGAWTGNGIKSSTAAGTSGVTSLGYLLNDNGSGGAFYSTFTSESVDVNSILVKYTYAGDADLSGLIDGTDYALIDNGFSGSLTGWLNGDFNYDGSVNGTDYAIIDTGNNGQSGQLAQSSPLAIDQAIADWNADTDGRTGFDDSLPQLHRQNDGQPFQRRLLRMS